MDVQSLEIMPVRVRLAAILRKSILSGELKNGQELSLTGLAEEFNVSRTPVREAFQILEQEGLLQLRMNRGAIVKGIDEKFIQDHFDMRILLEGEAAFRAAERGMDVSALMQEQNRAEARFLTMDPDEYGKYNQELHVAIWRAADNQKLYDCLSGLWNGPSIGRSVEPEDHRAKSIQEHGYILRCIDRRLAEEARAAMSEHIRRSKKNMLESFRQEGGLTASGQQRDLSAPAET